MNNTFQLQKSTTSATTSSSLTNIDNNDKISFKESITGIEKYWTELNNELEKKNISTEVVNMHTIKPLDEKKILSILESSKLLVSVEEHNIIGGLGSAISEVISSSKQKKTLLRLGINDKYSKSGSYNYLKNYYGLSSDKIIKNILKILK